VTRVIRHALPGGVLLAAAAVALALPASAEAIDLHSPAAAPALLVVAACLAIAFRSGRLLMAALACGLAAWAIDAAAGGDERLVGFVSETVAALLPVNLALAAWLPERGALSLPGLRRATFLALQVGFAWLAWAAFVPWLIELPGRPFLPAWIGGRPGLADAAIAAFSLATAALLIRLVVRPGAVEGALWWSLVAAFVAVGAGGGRAIVWLAVAGAVLTAGALESAVSIAFADPLTGLPSRRTLDEALGRLGERFAVAMVDIDRFKRVNDTYGHDVGDQVLRMVASRLRAVGGGGRAYRYGGEEFAILFPGRAAKEARPFLDAVRQAVADSEFVVRGSDRPEKRPEKPARAAGGPALAVTVSIGLAESSEKVPAPLAVMEAADRALLKAKRDGRNRLVG